MHGWSNFEAVYNDQKIYIVRVKEGEDFFAIGNNVFTESRPLSLLNIKQNQQLKLKVVLGVVYTAQTER